MENNAENQKNLSGLEQVYLNQKEKLFSLYKNNLPQSIRLLRM